MELSVQLRSGSPVPVVAVGGELDLESGPCLAGWLRWLLQARGPLLALDLTGVRFIDCAGVSALVASCRMARQDGGRLFVVALSPCARRIIEITRLQEVLGVVGQHEHAEACGWTVPPGCALPQ
jgi:anti-sigma B factor antagonist